MRYIIHFDIMKGIPEVWLIRILTLAYRFAFSFKISKELQSYTSIHLVDSSPNLYWDSQIMFSFFKSTLPHFQQVLAMFIFLDRVHTGYTNVHRWTYP